MTATEDLVDVSRRQPGELRRAVLRAHERRAAADRGSARGDARSSCRAATASSASTARATRCYGWPEYGRAGRRVLQGASVDAAGNRDRRGSVASSDGGSRRSLLADRGVLHVRRESAAAGCTCCCGSTRRRSARPATTRWRGRSRSAAAARTTTRSATSPRPGPTRASSGRSSARSVGPPAADEGPRASRAGEISAAEINGRGRCGATRIRREFSERSGAKSCFHSKSGWWLFAASPMTVQSRWVAINQRFEEARARADPKVKHDGHRRHCWSAGRAVRRQRSLLGSGCLDGVLETARRRS